MDEPHLDEILAKCCVVGIVERVEIAETLLNESRQPCAIKVQTLQCRLARDPSLQRSLEEQLGHAQV